jgi:hypothetical protein
MNINNIKYGDCIFYLGFGQPTSTITSASATQPIFKETPTGEYKIDRYKLNDYSDVKGM